MATKGNVKGRTQPNSKVIVGDQKKLPASLINDDSGLVPLDDACLGQSSYGSYSSSLSISVRLQANWERSEETDKCQIKQTRFSFYLR